MPDDKITQASMTSPGDHTNGREGSNTEYPINPNPMYINGRRMITGYIESEVTIRPEDHFQESLSKAKVIPSSELNNSEHTYDAPKYYVSSPEGHFTKEADQHNGTIDSVDGNINPEYAFGDVFSGFTTQVNPTNDPNKQEILDSSLALYLEEGSGKTNGDYGDLKGTKPPISPIAPFISHINDINDQHMADKTIFNSYNRTRLPVADIEWRKGFRHIFISRPECYLMGFNANGTGVDICDQVKLDDDFATANMRMPHIIRLLSPWYVSGGSGNQARCNWNYLLSNRALGMGVGAMQMTTNDTVGKSIEGFTVTPAMHVESRQGATLDIAFQDTKELEIFESARLWMLYMYKRKKGIFFPPYNGYKTTNGFIPGIPSSGKRLEGANLTQYHPYDRAIEYGASLYDIITNESGDKILYWCKYYGIYPISVTPSLDNDHNGPITTVQTNITFKYHYKLENNQTSLVEFNHDAGIVDDLGGLINDVNLNASMSWLLKNDGTPNVGNPGMSNYIGAAGMFTGTPYVVMRRSRPDPISGQTTFVPYLGFLNVEVGGIDNYSNLGIVSPQQDPDGNDALFHYKT